MKGQTRQQQDNASFMRYLADSQRYSDEVLELVKDDLEYGLTQEQVKLYYRKKLDIGQMKVYSRCLRNGYEKEVMEVVTKDGLSANQMRAALDFYEKGVALEAVRKFADGSVSAAGMKAAYGKVLEKMQEAGMADTREDRRAEEILSRIGELARQLSRQDERYDTIEEKLASIGTLRREEELIEKLSRENEEKERLLDDQQERISKANAAIARLREQLSENEREAEGLKQKIRELEAAAQKPKPEKQGTGDAAGGGDAPQPDIPGTDNAHIPKIPVYYRMPLTDSSGKAMQVVVVEPERHHADGGRENGRFRALLGKLRQNRRNTAGIAQMALEGELSAEQIAQVKYAMEQGLTQEQIGELIKSRAPAEKMKGIIEIAVLENSMG